MRHSTFRTSFAARAAQILLVLIMLTSACASDVTVSDEEDAPSLPAEQQQELDAFIESALERYDVPGVAVALIKDGRIAYQAGYGLRDLDAQLPMTTSTLFSLASTTKPMTTTMMATLADDGILDWDQPVDEILPGFALSNPEWSKLARVRHFAGMSSGLPENNTSLFLQSLPTTGLLATLPEITSLAPPGELYGYSNVGFSTGAFAAAVLAGARYDDTDPLATYVRLMHERVFEPIGMSSATLDSEVAVANADHASPHRYDPSRDVVESMPIEAERFEHQVLPGGGVWADVRDVAKFAITHFDGKTRDGARLLSESSLHELHKGAVELVPGAQYALGWEVWDDYLGVKSLRHTGNSFGFTTGVRIVEEGKLGVVVLVNEGFVDGFMAAVERFALELLLEQPHVDDADALGAHTAQKDGLRDFAVQWKPVGHAEAEAYLGSYTHAASVLRSDEGLQLRTDYGDFELFATEQPGLLGIGGVLSGIIVIQRDDATPNTLTLGMPGGESLSWPLTIERLQE